MSEHVTAEYVSHEFDGIDRDAARCPHHPDQILVVELEWCGDLQFICPRADYRAIARDPGMHGTSRPKWEAPKGPSSREWVPPVRQLR